MYHQYLDEKLQTTWNNILDNSPLVKEIMGGTTDRLLYAIYMIETFHYTSHNAKNQALVVQNLHESTSQNIRYMQFCLKHASEEAGHELMAFHDLKKIGYDIKLEDLPKPLPTSQALIAYLYRVSEKASPFARLGYSYWAESSYKYFNKVLQTVAKNMELTPAMMTFFIEHGEIDDGHFKDIMKMTDKYVTTDEIKEEFEEVMINTLKLTGKILDDVYDAYIELKENPEHSAYKMLLK